MVFYSDQNILYLIQQRDKNLWTSPLPVASSGQSNLEEIQAIPEIEFCGRSFLKRGARGEIILLWQTLIPVFDRRAYGPIYAKVFSDCNTSSTIQLTEKDCELHTFAMNEEGEGLVIWSRGPIIEAVSLKVAK